MFEVYVGDQLRRDLAKLIAAAEANGHLKSRLLHDGVYLDNVAELYKLLEGPPRSPPSF